MTHKIFEKMITHAFLAVPLSDREGNDAKIVLENLPIWKAMTDEERSKVSPIIRRRGIKVTIEDGVATCERVNSGIMDIYFYRKKGIFGYRPYKTVGVIKESGIVSQWLGGWAKSWDNYNDYCSYIHQNSQINDPHVADWIDKEGILKRNCCSDFSMNDPFRTYVDYRGAFREMNYPVKSKDRKSFCYSEVYVATDTVFTFEGITKQEALATCSRAAIGRMKDGNVPFVNALEGEVMEKVGGDLADPLTVYPSYDADVWNNSPFELITTESHASKRIADIAKYIQKVIDDNADDIINGVYDDFLTGSHRHYFGLEDKPTVKERKEEIESYCFYRERNDNVEPLFFLNPREMPSAIIAGWKYSPYVRLDGGLKLKWPIKSKSEKVNECLAKHIIQKLATQERPLDLYYAGPAPV